MEIWGVKSSRSKAASNLRLAQDQQSFLVNLFFWRLDIKIAAEFIVLAVLAFPRGEFTGWDRPVLSAGAENCSLCQVQSTESSAQRAEHREQNRTEHGCMCMSKLHLNTF